MTTSFKGYPTHRFFIEIDGITQAIFNECSGLQAELETMTWQEGGNNESTYTLPVRAKWNNLTLKWGTASAELWTWFFNCTQGTISRKNISIILYGLDSMPQVRWNIIGALPIKWSGPTLKAGASEAAVESLDLTHEGFTRA